MTRPFADRSVVITGASDGIGAEVARQLAGQGAWLALGARRAHELDLVAQECISRGGRAIIVKTDVTDPAQCRDLIAHAMQSYGKVDVLVNNAGVGAHFAFNEATDLAVYDRVMRVNFLGSVYCTHAALAPLRQSKGLIVAVSSLAGKTGVPFRTAYSASKHAMQGFFDSLRLELGGSGIDVTLVSPGFVATDIRAHALGGDGKVLGESPLDERDVMALDECGRQIVDAMERRKREVIMTARGRIGLILKSVAPRMVDRMTADVMKRRSEERG
ncbi:MAG TPA: SDR family oxidoreductase [Gemmatimonadaceae bacterium]|nr:SDR family oxidoreductase [Gemmatimonadaceae bacterium]